MRLEEIEEGERLLAAYHDAMGRRASVDVKATKSDVDSWFHQHAPELIAAAKAAAWRTIETAPHKTKVMLFGRNSLGKARTVMAMYYAPPLHWDAEPFEGCEQAGDEWLCPAAWYEEIDAYDDVPLERVAFEPTHWRPIGPLPGDQS